MAQARPLALVTGASSGIGFELAKLFADDGYDLVVAADDDAIHACAEKLRASGGEVRAEQVDLRKPDDVDRLYRSVTENGRRLDAAALNAGTGGGGRFVDRGLEEDLNTIDLNIRGTTHLAKFVLQDMVSANSGKVLFTSSLVATMPGSHQTVYNASKSFVQSFAEALQDELRDTDVTITVLMPGATETNFFRRVGMPDTLVGRIPKDDPGKVAKQGYDALMRGEKKVVASSPLSKGMGLMNKFLPDSVKAASNRLISR
ncbi:SDR family NAD(P)-dependent oxidoreductase [Mycolicibacterium flavescens]|uniref:Oxidoreductase n=1 Tax=Mycolicibacterium flavescens TaxID=1776 RepID=A0A1E3RC66_MYCFV|nr:SDR family NAD(P)-dependent oxidoreductase [Mycolicibacterium flavescens]MCV7283076.1 SDR family NAD(P)-dependent oxidoreductase [Mycolicibacterium flavescens]ODQ87496.1 oxidoreductase [Mycolicibacterium flavescens]